MYLLLSLLFKLLLSNENTIMSKKSQVTNMYCIYALIIYEMCRRPRILYCTITGTT